MNEEIEIIEGFDDEFYNDFQIISKAFENNDVNFIKNNLDKYNDEILYLAIKHHNTEIFEYTFLNSSLDIQRQNLGLIIRNNYFHYLEFFLKNSSIDINDSHLHDLACRCGNFEMLKKLEELGIKKSQNSLFYALQGNNIELILYVYDGEDVSKHFNPLNNALKLDVLKFIMSKTELSSENKRRILLMAAGAGFIDVIEYLLNLPNPTDSTGALFETVYFGSQFETFKYLLTKAPVLSKIDEHEYRAFYWSYKHKYLDFVDYYINELNITPETSSIVFDIMKSDNFETYNNIKK